MFQASAESSWTSVLTRPNGGLAASLGWSEGSSGIACLSEAYGKDAVFHTKVLRKVTTFVFSPTGSKSQPNEEPLTPAVCLQVWF